MSADPIVTDYEIAGGTHLTLYANRMELHGGDAMEIVPLAHLASVRVAFERDPSKLHWAIGLLVTGAGVRLDLLAPAELDGRPGGEGRRGRRPRIAGFRAGRRVHGVRQPRPASVAGGGLPRGSGRRAARRILAGTDLAHALVRRDRARPTRCAAATAGWSNSPSWSASARGAQELGACTTRTCATSSPSWKRRAN